LFKTILFLNNKASFEPDVMLYVSVIPLQHRSLFYLHVFRQYRLLQRIVCLAPRYEITLSDFLKERAIRY